MDVRPLEKDDKLADHKVRPQDTIAYILGKQELTDNLSSSAFVLRVNIELESVRDSQLFVRALISSNIVENDESDPAGRNRYH